MRLRSPSGEIKGLRRDNRAGNCSKNAEIARKKEKKRYIDSDRAMGKRKMVLMRTEKVYSQKRVSLQVRRTGIATGVERVRRVTEKTFAETVCHHSNENMKKSSLK